MQSTPQEQERLIPPSPMPVETGRFPYGWRPAPFIGEDGCKTAGVYIKQFTHNPRTVLLGAPKRGARWLSKPPNSKRQEKRFHEAQPTRYIVWPDRSLRNVNKLLRDQFANLSVFPGNEGQLPDCEVATVPLSPSNDDS